MKRKPKAVTNSVPAASPPAIVFRHVGAGADGFGHSPGALAASELFVQQQHNRDELERTAGLDDKMRALGRAAAHRLSVCMQMQEMDNALAEVNANRCRDRLAQLSQDRRGRLAGEKIDSGMNKDGDHMSIRKTVDRCKGLQDCTNVMWATQDVCKDKKNTNVSSTPSGICPVAFRI